MYEVDSDIFPSKPNPKKEFTHYFKESGAAAALQKAMILLYRMPVKPTNLAKFFSQYFENGAQQVMRISLLKAELCYKRDELRNRKLKVKESETRIKQLIAKLGISEEEFNQRFLPERIKEKNRFSILERYFKDVESKFMKRTVEETPIHKTSSYLVDPVIEVNEHQDSNYDLENDCLKNVRSDSALKEDIKELDPWGIICKAPKGDELKKSFTIDHGFDDHGHADEDHEPDEDDATSLAELFQQSSRDWVIQDHDEHAAKLHNHLLMVRKADKIKISDFLGWTPLQSREDLRITPSTPIEPPSSYNTPRGSQDIELLKRKPCLQQKTDMLRSHGFAGHNDMNPQEPENDALLLDDDHMEHVDKMIETTQDSFDYVFQRKCREPKAMKEEICEPICDLLDVDRICSQSMRFLHGQGLYGEDDLGYDSINESLGFIPGKMQNWTNEYIEYPTCSTPGEYPEFQGESTQPCSDEPRAEVPMRRVDSSCHCIFTGVYDAKEMLSETPTKGDAAIANDADSISGNSNNMDHRLSLQQNEATITEDTALENELNEVFKQKSNRKSNPKKDKEKKADNDTEEPPYIVEVFGIDLAKEVKRTVLGMKSSEIDNTDAVNHANHASAPTHQSPSQPKPKYKF